MRVLSRWGGSKFGSRTKRAARANPCEVKYATEGDRLMRLIDNRRREAEANARRIAMNETRS
jgi:hypothetical protein